MKIKPLKGVVHIKPDKPRDKTDGGLLIYEDWKTLPLTGKVLAVGEGVEIIHPGDKVMFMRYASLILEDDERLVLAKHIHGILA